MIELGRLRGQVYLDVSRAFLIGQLGKRYGAILLGASELLTPRLSPYCVTCRVNVVQYKKSVNCANKVLPICIKTSGQKPERLDKLAITFQIDTALNRLETRASRGFLMMEGNLTGHIENALCRNSALQDVAVVTLSDERSIVNDSINIAFAELKSTERILYGGAFRIQAGAGGYFWKAAKNIPRKYAKTF